MATLSGTPTIDVDADLTDIIDHTGVAVMVSAAGRRGRFGHRIKMRAGCRFDRPRPDRGEGGKYLSVGPGYGGYLPEDGFSVAHARTNGVVLLGRSFPTNDDPALSVEVVEGNLAIDPYAPGGVGLSLARCLEGGVRLGRSVERKTPIYHEGTGLAIDTVPPNDQSQNEMPGRLVQSEPADVLDNDLMGPIAAIGIKKGEVRAPDDRMREILEDAIEVANATGRTPGFMPRRTTRHRRPKRQRTARPPSGSRRTSRTGSAAATVSRPTPKKGWVTLLRL